MKAKDIKIGDIIWGEGVEEYALKVTRIFTCDEEDGSQSIFFNGDMVKPIPLQEPGVFRFKDTGGLGYMLRMPLDKEIMTETERKEYWKPEAEEGGGK